MRTNLRPRAISTHEQVGRDRCAIGKAEFVPSAPERRNRRNLMSPLDHFRRDRIDKHSPQIAAVNFGATADVAAGMVEQDGSVFIDNTFCVFARADETEERVEEPCGFEGDLTVIFVNIEQASLRSCARRDFSFVNRCREAMQVQNTSECEATEPGSDNRNWLSHRCAPVVTSKQRLWALMAAIA